MNGYLEVSKPECIANSGHHGNHIHIGHKAIKNERSSIPSLSDGLMGRSEEPHNESFAICCLLSLCSYNAVTVVYYYCVLHRYKNKSY